MLSDEEKKAIEYLKIEYEKLMKEDNILFPLYKSDAKRLIDIIEKQSKEIEELKNQEATARRINELLVQRYSNSISFQKVKDKIEELNKKEQKLQNSISAEEREEYSDANISWDLMDINIKREVLQSLLEERN